MKVEELIEGEIYTASPNSQETWIFTAKKDKQKDPELLSVHGRYYYENSGDLDSRTNSYFKNVDYKLATSKEKQHLLECRKYKKWVKCPEFVEEFPIFCY